MNLRNIFFRNDTEQFSRNCEEKGETQKRLNLLWIGKRIRNDYYTLAFLCENLALPLCFLTVVFFKLLKQFKTFFCSICGNNRD